LLMAGQSRFMYRRIGSLSSLSCYRPNFVCEALHRYLCCVRLWEPSLSSCASLWPREISAWFKVLQDSLLNMVDVCSNEYSL